MGHPAWSPAGQAKNESNPDLPNEHLCGGRPFQGRATSIWRTCQAQVQTGATGPQTHTAVNCAVPASCRKTGRSQSPP